jgi:tetratricopeptide (TPR) repeat protein
LRLSEEIGDTERIFPALYSRQVFELTRGQFDRAAEHAREALQLAVRNPSSDSGPFAGRLFATLRLFRGEAGIACEQLRRMLSQYDPARHRESAHRFGQDHSVACACYLALGLWHLGFPEQARQYSDRAIDYARSLGHAHTLQFALAYGGAYFAAHCRDADYLDATTSEMVELGKTHSSRSWSAALTGLLGMLLIERGRTRDGIAGLRTGLEALREFSSMLWQPAFCSWLARAYATCGEVSQGFAAIDMGRQVAASGERWMDAELHRAEGELWQVEGSAHLSRAEVCLRQSLAVAQAQSSRILELRAAISLARLWRRQGRWDEALATLGSAADWFTEGHDNADWHEAAALMKALRNREPL